MADDPVKELGNQTPLQKANKPVMDHMAKYAELGLVKTVPDHLNPPGSDIANMSVLGYDPDRYYTGRSPLEAVSMGIDLAEDDIAIRCNLVTLSDEARYEDTTMVDYSSDEITTAEAGELIRFLDQKLGTDQVRFYPGVSYRHCVVLKHQKTADLHFTPPHDISGKKIAPFLPKGETAAMLYDLMRKSRALLKDHPVNLRRIQNGLRPASSVWLWGQGRKPSFDSFYDRHHVKGAVISAVDLVKGLGICAGMEVPDVPGATGNIDTNYEGKADAAIAFSAAAGSSYTCMWKRRMNADTGRKFKIRYARSNIWIKGSSKRSGTIWKTPANRIGFWYCRIIRRRWPSGHTRTPRCPT